MISLLTMKSSIAFGTVYGVTLNVLLCCHLDSSLLSLDKVTSDCFPMKLSSAILCSVFFIAVLSLDVVILLGHLGHAFIVIYSTYQNCIRFVYSGCLRVFVADINETRLKMATEMGADVVIGTYE
jgi:hypothetical protein